MRRPTIVTVDDDPDVSAAISRDLHSQYGSEYRVVAALSGEQALATLARLALRDQPVALIVADQRMPAMTGIELLRQAETHAPGAKKLLLTAYADTNVAVAAINDIGLDYYLLKPWNPPRERLFPAIDGLLTDWRHANPDRAGGLRVVGHRWSVRSHEVKTFLDRNHVPYLWFEIDRDAEARRLVELAGATMDDLPLVLVPDGPNLRSPAPLDLADAMRIRTQAEQPLYDVCVVGGGPAGLAAAVYAASEGLSTVIVEREAPGGQASQSAAIENYLGFPKGLTGSRHDHHRAKTAIRATRGEGPANKPAGSGQPVGTGSSSIRAGSSAGSSVREARMVSAPAARRSAPEYRPVVTATSCAPETWAAVTSLTVSPMSRTSWGAMISPRWWRARSSATPTRADRSAWSSPKAPRERSR
jgi:CheY-like chemotaxis protein